LHRAWIDARQRKKRRQGGGNKKTCFQDGWVEFENKKEAKRLARSLNNTPVGGKAKFWR
jgi:ESF2/ABP1 family protein